MGQRLLIILALLLMVRPITLAENFACGEEFAVPTSTPTKKIPCSDIAQPSEIVESSQHCPCFALIQPESAGITMASGSFSLFTGYERPVETTVAEPPTPPPRLV
jgi:hypothetical protein